MIANPIPAADEIPSAIIEPVIQAAIQEVDAQQCLGKDLTPFCYAVAKATKVRDSANIRLIKNNVLLGVQLAMALCA